MKNFKITVTNIDEVTKEFTNAKDFVDYITIIHKENEEDSPSIPVPETVDQAIEYVIEYCSNLMIIVHHGL